MPSEPDSDNSSTTLSGRRFDWRNAVLVIVAPVVFFALLEGILALARVEPVLYPEDPYVGFSSRVPLFVPAAEDPAVLETAANKLRLFNPQRFPRKKPAGTTRIFCVGGSTTFGRPYDHDTSFCGWLARLLPAIVPDRQWEVINAGGVSYASYRSALVMEELAGYEPDVFVIYSGHNEFLEERTYSGLIAVPEPIRGVGAVASRTRTWALLRSVLLPESRADDEDDVPLMAAEVTTKLDASVGPDAYERDDALAETILAHYRFNLARMVDIARAAGAQPILVTPASNLRDCTPFKSQSSLAGEGEERARFERRLGDAREALRQGGHEEARAAATAAVALDPRHAEAQYRLGAALDALGETAAAREAFTRARDEDVCPLRAPTPIARLVRETAERREVELFDFAARTDALARDGIPGADLFLDHVHPTIDAHRELAVGLLSSLRSLGVLPTSSRWEPELVAGVAREVEAGLDRAAHGRALLNLSKVLGWAGKLEDSAHLAARAVELAPEEPGAHYQAGLTAQLTGRLEEAIGHYRRSLDLAPNAVTTHGNLAAALEARGQRLQAILHYRRALALLGDEESPYKQQLTATLERLGATPRG